MSVQRALILDFNDEYGEFNIKSIAFEHIPLFIHHPKPDIRRLRPFYLTNGGKWVKMTVNDMLETLKKTLEIYKGGALLVEDINKYVDDDMPKDLTGMLASNAHSDMDLIMHYQSIGRPLPKVWQNTNIVRYHCQFDSVKRSKSKLQDLLEVFQIAELMVNEQYYQQNNKRFFVYIDRDSGKIIGNYTHAMFDKALDEFISVNHDRLQPYLRKRDHKGKPVYTYPQAEAECKKRLFQQYFGNNEQTDNIRESKVMIATGRKRVGKSHETIRYLCEDYCNLPFGKK